MAKLERENEQGLRANDGADRPSRKSRAYRGTAPEATRRKRIPPFVIISDLPERLPVTKAEIAIWRSFLSEEIDAILYSD